MILTSVQCDHCGTVRTDPTEARWAVELRLRDLGWTALDNVHLCPSCTLREEDG